MQVLLLTDVAKLGKKGSVVEVAAGFAENFLFPKRMAIKTDEKLREQLENEAKKQDAKATKLLAKAQNFKTRVEGRNFTIHAKVGENNHLFGAVREKDIAEKISQEMETRIDKIQIHIPEPIKALGQHVVKLKLASNIEASIKINVVKKD